MKATKGFLFVCYPDRNIWALIAIPLANRYDYKRKVINKYMQYLVLTKKVLIKHDTAEKQIGKETHEKWKITCSYRFIYISIY